jgi:hypothetical protein
MKINNNLFGIINADPIPQNFTVSQGSVAKISIKCKISPQSSNPTPPQGSVIIVQAGLKCSMDLFYFNFPVLLHTMFEEQDPESLNKHKIQSDWNRIELNP